VAVCILFVRTLLRDYVRAHNFVHTRTASAQVSLSSLDASPLEFSLPFKSPFLRVQEFIALNHAVSIKCVQLLHNDKVINCWDCPSCAFTRAEPMLVFVHAPQSERSH